MGIAASELREYVIRPTLLYLGRHSSTAEVLLLSIAACQSSFGEALHGQEDSYGLYRISGDAHKRLWDEHLALDPNLASQVRGLASQHAFLTAPHVELTVNLRYATAIAWMLIEAHSVELPDSDDIHRLARIWRRVFQPKGHLSDFIQAWPRCLPDCHHVA